MPAEALILFDIDGTLLRGAGGHHKAALIEAVRQVTGHATTLEGINTAGALERDLIRLMLLNAGASKRAVVRHTREILAASAGCYAENCPDLRRFLCPGLPSFLDDVRARGAVLGLVTGNPSAIGWTKVERAGLREYFQVGAFSEDGHTRARLARVALWRALRNGLVQKKCRVSLIGDHMNDIAAAKANSFLSVAVATGLTPASELLAQQPDILVQDLTELDPALLV